MIILFLKQYIDSGPNINLPKVTFSTDPLMILFLSCKDTLRRFRDTQFIDYFFVFKQNIDANANISLRKVTFSTE